MAALTPAIIAICFGSIWTSRALPLPSTPATSKASAGEASENERIAEAQETRRIVSEEMGGYESRNFVITGDLNDTPDSKTLRVLNQPWEGQPALYDSLADVPANQAKTFPSKGPKDQIDHILMPQHLRDNLVESHVYRDGESKTASDHLMVTATFKLNAA